MSTFGEIVEPVSRTTWEDWDEVYAEENVTIIQWQLPIEIPKRIETLFILEGKFLSDFMKVQSRDFFKLINSNIGVNLHLYQLTSSDKYICTVKDYNLLKSSEIIELLKPFIYKSEDVITIQTKPIMEYQTASLGMQSWVIRQLTTSVPSKKTWDLNFAKLEQPNILSGVTAGAICLREHINLSATALVCYIEHIEEYQTNELLKLLEKFEIIDDTCSAKCSGILSSNLYI
ncbi:uncharacterized protein LOC113402556 [Vanessa tameamea]|uniref:Proteasome assembly chaperone 1 n=1 Tax=Vanessa tameamea TaxID=334116 RepID=A0A8B8ISD7_VANTA|nr:uncharacterized protein LOC113402556 [Vanessa tameamea]